MNPVPALVISPRDNVATALQPLAAGQTIVLGGQSITIAEATPRGHKIALRLIRRARRSEVRQHHRNRHVRHRTRRARAHAQRRERSRAGSAPRKNTEEHGTGRTQTQRHPTVRGSPSRQIRSPVTGKSRAMSALTFSGYRATRRPRRRPQSRPRRTDRHLCVGRRGADRKCDRTDRRGAAASRRLRPAWARSAPHARDARRVLRTPERRRVVVVALGCEQVIAQHLADAARTAGKPAAIIAIQSEGGTVRTTTRGIEIATSFAAALQSEQRVPCDLSSLILCVKCGGSDYTSGLSANPALGTSRGSTG